MNDMYTSCMEFLCYASGNYHKNIYITKEMDAYVCWHDLDNKGRKWHRDMDKTLATEHSLAQKRAAASQDLYVFDDVPMDPDFNPRHKKSDV